jgi:hypothetical protein
MDGLSTTLTVFSAMLTPVILISASGALTISTSNRLSRAVDRARKIAEMVEQIVQADATGALFEERRNLIFMQLSQITRRARLLHRALTSLYLALGVFVATSVALGVVAITNSSHTGFPLLFGLVGVALLFYTTVLLIAEARIARSAIDAEMDFVLRLAEHYAPPDLAGTLRTRGHLMRRL